MHKKNLTSILVAILLILSAIASATIIYPQLRFVYLLNSGYPTFLKVGNIEKVDSEILTLSSHTIQLSSEDMEKLWKLLWIKKDISKKDYITEEKRARFIEKTSYFSPSNLDQSYYQFNTLKYKLGINNIEELETYLNKKLDLCNSKKLFIKNIKWNDSFKVGYYFDVIHFCNLNYSNLDEQRLNSLTSSKNDELTIHLKEHGITDVPVYVNDCSKATNENEKYHCLFFITS